MTTTTCDRCGDNLDAIIPVARRVEAKFGLVSPGPREVAGDLCATCQETLARIMAKFIIDDDSWRD